MKPSYREVNRRAWAYLARNGCDSSQPYGPAQFAHARAHLDIHNWIPWRRIRHVLCLGASGGQQAPLFAALGYRVVSADLSRAQLARDAQVAHTHDLEIECVAADMLDLSELHGRNFDLVYQGISACYVPDVARLYREVANVLHPHGYYYVEHWNPTHLQLADDSPWTGRGYLIAKPLEPHKPIVWTIAAPDGGTTQCLHYMHSLGALIGALAESGFHIQHCAERPGASASARPGSDAHLSSYLPSFYGLFAQRCQAPRNQDLRNTGASR